MILTLECPETRFKFAFLSRLMKRMILRSSHWQSSSAAPSYTTPWTKSTRGLSTYCSILLWSRTASDTGKHGTCAPVRPGRLLKITSQVLRRWLSQWNAYVTKASVFVTQKMRTWAWIHSIHRKSETWRCVPITPRLSVGVDSQEGPQGLLDQSDSSTFSKRLCPKTQRRES